MTKAAVFGAGSWGTAFALVLADAGHEVTMWGRREDLCAAINEKHENPEYLPGVELPPSICATHEPAEAAERFMRRLIGDERWQRLPESTRVARRGEGAAMVGELIDLRSHAPWDPTSVSVPTVAIHGSLGAAHHAASTRYLGDVLADGRVVEIDGARHFGPNTHPDAVATEVAALVSRAATTR